MLRWLNLVPIHVIQVQLMYYWWRSWLDIVGVSQRDNNYRPISFIQKTSNALIKLLLYRECTVYGMTWECCERLVVVGKKLVGMRAASAGGPVLADKARQECAANERCSVVGARPAPPAQERDQTTTWLVLCSQYLLPQSLVYWNTQIMILEY